MPRPHRHLYPVYQLWRGGYEANVTGLAGMVSYNLLLAIFPFALLLLFVLGTILGSPHDQNAVVQQLEHVFPSIAEGTLRRALDTIRDNATKIGIASGIVGVWIGASFWGSMDTAFGQIYDRPSRPWVHQKLFGIGMLIVSVMFLGASIVLPTLQGLLLSGARHVLPFGLGRVQALGLVIGIAADLVVLFVVTSAIYFAVPRGLVARGLAGRARRDDRDRDRQLGLPVVPHARLYARQVRNDVRVHPHRPDLVLRGGDHPPHGRRTQQHAPTRERRSSMSTVTRAARASNPKPE